MRNRFRGTAGILILVLVGLVAGCAGSDRVEGPLPAHPFPRWVSSLENGKTRQDEVRQVFGAPKEIEASPRGGLVWRYVHSEPHWPEGDAMRPRVATSPEKTTRAAEDWKAVKKGSGNAFRWIDTLVSYPPAQPRPTRKRSVPATIHQLELTFSPDGTLRRYHYAPGSGMARVPVGG